MRIPLVLGQSSDKAKASQESVERLLNAYLERVPKGKEPEPIYGTPGLTVWCSGLAGAVRGALEMTGAVYAVAGTSLCSIASNGTETLLGSVPGTDVVQMAGDGINVVLVSAGEIYVWNGATLGPVTDPDAPAASSVVWLDSFFVFGELGTQQWFISALADPTNYDALDFASAEWKPDNLVTPVVLRDTLYLAGTKTFEAQQNTGAAAFPFSAYQDLKIDVGLAGRDAVTTTNDSMFWQANDDTIRRLDGLTATVVSTPAIGRLIAAWADKTATVASSHVWDHHLFVVFRNPDGCVVFDQTTERWHERGSYQSATWQVRHMIDAYDLKLFASATTGTIYKLDETVFDEDGSILEFEIVTPFAYVQNRRLTVTEVELVCETGVGTTTLDPVVTAERTRDGVTWSDRKPRHLGKQGERGTRVSFGVQGSERAMAWRFRITDPVKRAVFGAYAEADVEA